MGKLVIVTDGFPQLTETFIARQVDYLMADVITKSFNEELYNKYKYKSGKILSFNKYWPVSSKVYKYLLKISFKIFKTPTYYWYPSYHYIFQKYLQDLKTEAVLAQFGPAGINCYPVCKKLNIPLFVHFHGYDASQLLHNKSYVRELKLLLAYVKSVIVVNKTMAEELIKVGCRADKIEIIPYGVPVQNFLPVEKDYNTPFHFLSVGRFVAKKSPINVVKAFELCIEKNDHCMLTMIGDGPLFRDVLNYVKKSRYKERIKLLGAQPQEIVKQYYDKAHAFVQHSVTPQNKDMEGWPVAIAEACACGLPVVSTFHAGIKDQIVHSKTGFLVEEGDFRSMSQFMLMLASDIDLAAKMSKATREFIEKNGNFDVQALKLKKLINSI